MVTNTPDHDPEIKLCGTQLKCHVFLHNANTQQGQIVLCYCLYIINQLRRDSCIGSSNNSGVNGGEASRGDRTRDQAALATQPAEAGFYRNVDLRAGTVGIACELANLH